MSNQKELDEFIARAGFTYGWRNLESWARRMAEQAVEELEKSNVKPVAWTPRPDEFKGWCTQYFGPDADESYLAEAVLNLPAMAQKFKWGALMQIVDAVRRDADPAFAHLLHAYDSAIAQGEKP